MVAEMSHLILPNLVQCKEKFGEKLFINHE